MTTERPETYDTSNPIPDVLNVDEVAAYLRIPRSSIYKLAKRGALPCQKVGRQWRFSRKAIDAWLAKVGGEHDNQ